MSALDDLRAAGFSDDEVSVFATQKRQALKAGGFSDEETNAYLGPPAPNMAQGNKTFARALADRAIEFAKGAGEKINAGVEATANTAVGLIAFPTALVGAPLSVAKDWLTGTESEGIEGAVSRISQRISGPLYQETSDLGQKYTDVIGDAINQVAGPLMGLHMGVSSMRLPARPAEFGKVFSDLPPVLRDELARKVTGQTVDASDIRNSAKVIAGPDAPHEVVTSVENSLHQTYEKTGIGPYTVLAEAQRTPEIKADLMDPAVGVPKALEEFIPKAPENVPVPGDGLPLLNVEQPSSKTYREGAATLNMGLNPAQVLADVRDSYTPFVGVEQDHVKPPAVDSYGKPKSAMGDSFFKVFAPAARGEAAAEMAGIMRGNLGEMAREREVALEGLRDTAATFDKMPVAENVKFVDAMEKGVPLTDKKLAAAASDIRTLLDAKRDEVQFLGKGQLDNFDENYFPHMWKDPDQASAMFSRRPLTGSGDFLKARTIPYMADGLRWRAYDAEDAFLKSYDTEAEAKAAAGPEGRVGKPLKPITTNPVEMALLKAREMDKYVYGQKIFAEMKDADLARFVGFGDTPPPGWTKINDKVARVFQKNEGEGGGMILRGEYYAPDEAATLINNHLSPGLQGNAFFDAWRGIGSAMNSLQLGLSLFHMGFTSMDAMISKVALGVKQISHGDLTGIGSVAQGLNPAQPFINVLKGDKLLKAYLGKLDDPSLAPIVDAIMQAGGRVKMDDFYRNEAVNTFKQALRNDDYLGAAKSFLPTVLDRMSAPIFEQLVPRQKLGVFFDMAKDWLEKNPKADVTAKREGLGKLWDSVDNRMGQLVYDNVFWNHALKDGLMATVRSVGWNLGTFRELGGGLLDIKDITRDKGLSDRTAYVIALPMVAAIYGSILNYAYTGEGPQDIKDAFYPRTGRLRPDGSEDRVSLPTYMKDVFAYGQDVHNFAEYGADPTQTLKNKAHPLIATVSQMLNNQDFFGGAIRNPADKITQQIADEAGYLLKQVEPFSYRNYIQQAKEKGEEPTFMGYLTSPSMVGVAPAPGYMTKSAEQLESAQVNRMREPLIQKYREAIKNGMNVEEAIPEMLKGGLSRRDIKYVIQSSGDVPKPTRLKKFGE